MPRLKAVTTQAPTKKKTSVKKKVKNVRSSNAVKQKQRVSVTVNVNSNNKRKIVVATKSRQLPPLNPIIQVPYNTSQFMQTHGQDPILKHEPVRVPIEPLEPIRTITSSGMLPPVTTPSPDPMLRAPESSMTPIPYPRPSSLKPKPQFFTPVKETTRANQLLAEATSPRPITPPMGVNASTSVTRINLPQIREYLRNVRGFTKAQSNSIKNSDKQSYLDEHGQAIQNYLNNLDGISK
jgi:hypothetical protein